MKTRLTVHLIIFCSLVVIALTACVLQVVRASGPIVTKEFDLNNFDAIRVSLSGSVTIHRGETFQVSIKTNENVFKFIDVKVHGKDLDINTQPGINIVFADKPEINITLPELTKVSQAGSGEILLKDDFSGKGLELSISGSGKMDIPSIVYENITVKIAGSGDVKIDSLVATNFKCSISGSGDIIAAGKSNKMKVAIAGSGNIKAKDLHIEDATLSIAGNGNCYLDVTGKLDISIAGSGDVFYTGKPDINLKSAGSGKVHNNNK